MANELATEPPVPCDNHEEDIFEAEDCKEYYLFLLEFFVKRVSGSRLAKLNQMFFVPTSVHFSFLDFVDENELQVTPVDPLFQPQAGIATEVEIFNSGKSVLFAVDHDSATDRNAKLILTINVKKRMPDGIKPDVLVGSCELDLSSQYAALRIETLHCWQKGVTISQTFDDHVELLHNDNVSGSIEMYARISSFGQTIVTEFDTPRDPISFIFGAEEMDQSLLYQCDKLTVDSIDLLKSSSDDLENSRICSVCSPKAQICIPCKRRGAVQKKDAKPICISKKSVEKLAWKKSVDAMCTLSKTRVPTIKSAESDCNLCGKPVVLKVSGLFDCDDSKKPTVTVCDKGTTDVSTSEYDIFVLRIGKKGLVGADEKSDIQLEMKTPKGPERRPPIRYETRDMQTEVAKPPVLKLKKKKKRKKRKK